MACISPRTRKPDHAEGCCADRNRERDPLLTPQEAARYLGFRYRHYQSGVATEGIASNTSKWGLK